MRLKSHNLKGLTLKVLFLECVTVYQDESRHGSLELKCTNKSVRQPCTNATTTDDDNPLR
jgi:hypothetical protein